MKTTTRILRGVSALIVATLVASVAAESQTKADTVEVMAQVAAHLQRERARSDSLRRAACTSGTPSLCRSVAEPSQVGWYVTDNFDLAAQISTFGRRLQGHADELIGFEQSLFEIEDPEFVATSGKSHHAIVKFNGRHDSRVRGMVFEVTDSELAQADAYEPAGYRRVSAKLASGRRHGCTLTRVRPPEVMYATATGRVRV